MIDHCISAFIESEQEKVYKTYVTDVLSYVAHNTASKVGDQYASMRYIDIINPKEEETKTGDEVALEVIKKLGLKVEE